MANDPRLATYLGSGTLASRPAAPSIDSAMTAMWYSTDTGVASMYAGGAWHDLGIGDTQHPGYVVGRKYTHPLTATSNVTLTANRLYAIPFHVGVRSQAFASAAVYLNTGVAATQLEIGIYNNSNGAPSSLVKDFGATASTASATFITESSSVTLAQGWYWLAVASSGAISLRSSSADLSTYNLGMVNQNDGQERLYGAWAFAAGALPDPFPTVVYENATAPPLVWLVP